jgi:hypothetical protein
MVMITASNGRWAEGLRRYFQLGMVSHSAKGDNACFGECPLHHKEKFSQEHLSTFSLSTSWHASLVSNRRKLFFEKIIQDPSSCLIILI